MKKCVICGKEFKPRLEVQTTCGSEECKKENARRVSRAYYKKKEPLKEKKCEECGKLFTPRTPQQVTCSEECRKIRGRRAAKEWAATHKKERKPKEPKTYQKICEICGKEYICKNPRQKYCGDACARSASASQKRTNGYRVREMERERKRAEKRAKRIQTSHEALVDAEVEARAAGMTYGQWQARRYAYVGRSHGSN